MFCFGTAIFQKGLKHVSKSAFYKLFQDLSHYSIDEMEGEQLHGFIVNTKFSCSTKLHEKTNRIKWSTNICFQN